MNLCRLYLRFCKRFGPDNLTYSAYAWKLHQTGDCFWANRIDGVFLFFLGQRGHCEAQFLRESANQPS